MKCLEKLVSLTVLLVSVGAGNGCALLFAPEPSCDRYDDAIARSACHAIDDAVNTCGDKGVKSVKVSVGPSTSTDDAQVDAAMTTRATCND